MCTYENFHYGPQLFSAPYYIDFARQRCCMAEAMKMFSFRKNILPILRTKNLLFLPCNMAAVQNLFTPLYTWLTILWPVCVRVFNETLMWQISINPPCLSFPPPPPPLTGLIWALRQRSKTFKAYFSKNLNRQITGQHFKHLSTVFQPNDFQFDKGHDI